MLGKALLSASVSAPPAVYVEDVFSTWLYTGNGSTQTITNGIDLSGKGGLVWIKARSPGYSHELYDTARGATNYLISSATNAQATDATRLTAFNSTGFTYGSGVGGNGSGDSQVSWTFRKAAKFFDVVTYTGNLSNLVVSHSLGSVPGCIIIKQTNGSSNWFVYHRSTTDIYLNTTAAATGYQNECYSVTSSTFTVAYGSTNTNLNASATYVAYVFAHDAGGFGTAGTDSVVKCGSYTGNGTVNNATTEQPGPEINLGWEPQWVMIKNTTSSDGWWIFDTMRGFNANPNGPQAGLYANTAGAESTLGPTYVYLKLTSTGFKITAGAGAYFNELNNNYIYIAIRRGPMKTPTVGTEVFAANRATPSTSNSFTTNFPVDLSVANGASNGIIGYFQDRLRGYPTTSSTSGNYPLLVSTNTNNEASYNNSSPYIWGADSNTAVKYGSNLGGLLNTTYAFRRAPGFFDVVAFKGSSSTFSVPHSLGVVPSLVLIKKRIDASGAGFAGWWVLSSEFSGGYMSGGSTSRLVLNTDAAAGIGVSSVLNSVPTSTALSLLSSNFNASDSFIAYLFATLTGVSKVGSYTGTGTTLSIDCGFTAGARFVMIKRTDSTGDWYVWDTARGIISGNDPYLLLNSTAAEVTNTDYIDPLSSGFQISSTAPAAINNNGGSFIFFAVA